MKTVSKKLFSLLLVAVLMVSVLPFQAFAATIDVDFYDYNWSTNTYTLVKQSHGMAAPTMTYHVDPDITAPTGYKFRGWVVYQYGMTFDQVNAAPVVSMESLQYDSVSFAASFELDTYTVNFSAGQTGVSDPASISAIYGMTFADSGKPFPYPNGTVDGYTFGGWKYGNTILTSSNWGSVKFETKGAITLQAHWIPDNLTVTFYRWNNEQKAYEGIKAVTVPYGGSVKAADVPTLAQIDTKSNYEAIGWQTTAGTDAVAVEPAYAKITADTGFYARYLGDVVTITLDPKDGQLDDVTKEVRIGEKVGSYGGKLPSPSLAGYVFMGWETVNGDPITDDSVFMNSYSKLQAKWAVEANVRLIVKNAATEKDIASNLIPGGVKNGYIDVSGINLSKYLPSGSTYKLLGYVDKAGWDYYDLYNVINPVDQVKCASDGVTEVYAIVEIVSTNTNTNTNTGSGSNNTGSGNNTTTKPADPTNPATGDTSMIYVSMTVMTLAAAALVVAMQLRKRKMI